MDHWVVQEYLRLSLPFLHYRSDMKILSASGRCGLAIIQLKKLQRCPVSSRLIHTRGIYCIGWKKDLRSRYRFQNWLKSNNRRAVVEYRLFDFDCYNLIKWFASLGNVNTRFRSIAFLKMRKIVVWDATVIFPRNSRHDWATIFSSNSIHKHPVRNFILLKVFPIPSNSQNCGYVKMQSNKSEYIW